MRKLLLATLLAVVVIVPRAAQSEAAFPGTNGRIVFDTANLFFAGSGSSQIYSVRPDGSGRRQLTNMPDGSSAWQPRVSADGLSIVFIVSADGANDQLWLMRADGTHERPLTKEPHWSHGGASFRPGGGRIVYSRCGNYVAFYFTCRIVSVRRDGTGMRTVVGGTWHPMETAVSPSGSTVAYSSDKGGYDARLWLTKSDGSGARTIGPTFGAGTPSWSPDGSHIAFTGDNANGKVFTIASDGSDLKKVVPRAIFPAWSPNGQWLVYFHERKGDLERAHTDGTHVRTVVSSDTIPGIGFSDWRVTP